MGNVTIFEHENYHGRSQELPIGEYNLEQITIGNDTLTSLKVPFGLGAQLFWDRDFRGTDIILEFGEHANVGPWWNDKTSSIKILNRTVFFMSTDDPSVPGSIPAMFDGVFIGIKASSDGSIDPIIKLLPADKDKRFFKTLKARIPDGRTFSINEATQNGKTENRAGWTYSFDETSRILTVVLFVKPRELFGTRNWIGVEIKLS